MAKLLVQESTGVREFELVDNEIQLGRELDNSLRLADPSISRHHAVIRRTDSGFEVQDLQSSNGVLVNGTRVQTAILQDGDRVTLGQIQMTFVDPAAVTSFATTVVAAGEPVNPLGTMRMDANEMAKIQAMQPSVPAVPPPVVPAEVVLPEAQATTRNPVGEPRPFTYATVAPDNPAPSFLQPYLPPVPDDAQPTGERGDFVTRLLAVLIDGVVGFIAYLPFLILSFVPFLGCIIAPLGMLFGLAMMIFQLWCIVTYKATIGKKVMKLRVVREADPAAPLDWGIVLFRALGYFINGIIGFVIYFIIAAVLVGVIVASAGRGAPMMLLLLPLGLVAYALPYLLILGAERKGLQDMLSKTIVIKVDR